MVTSPLKAIQPVHSEGDQPWDFFGKNDAKAETPVLWPPHAKSWLIGKDSDAGRDWKWEEKGTTEDEMAGWHHRLIVLEFEWTLGVGDGQEAWRAAILGVAKSWARLSNWTELNYLWYLWQGDFGSLNCTRTDVETCLNLPLHSREISHVQNAMRATPGAGAGMMGWEAGQAGVWIFCPYREVTYGCMPDECQCVV